MKSYEILNYGGAGNGERPNGINVICGTCDIDIVCIMVS